MTIRRIVQNLYYSDDPNDSLDGLSDAAIVLQRTPEKRVAVKVNVGGRVWESSFVDAGAQRSKSESAGG